MEPDAEFEPGSLAYLLEKNFCRLLDQRRTPGVIEAVDLDAGFFRWRIKDFEDKGRYWDVPIEDVVRYQFSKGSPTLDSTAVHELKRMIERLREPLIVTPTNGQQEKFQSEIDKQAMIASSWLQDHSAFIKNGCTFDFQSTQGSSHISSDLLRFLSEEGVDELERKTADTYVLNPQSGEWMKGMQIVAAEAGMKEFRGSVIRTANLFSGIGTKENRQKYLYSRIGFVIAMFELLGRREVTLYRGMATEGSWSPSSPRFFSSWTFSKTVAEAFALLEPGDKSKNSYLIKRTIPTRKLFMTYIETAEMNRQYEEVEAVVAHDPSDERLW